MTKLQTGISTNLDFIRAMKAKGQTVNASFPAETLAEQLTAVGDNTITNVTPYEEDLENINSESAPVAKITVKVPEPTTQFLGKSVSDLVTDLAIDDGAVTGNFAKIEGFTDFSSIPDEQNGYYFPFELEGTGTLMTFKKNGVVTKEDIPFDSQCLFRVAKTDTFEVIVDEVSVVTFTFSGATFAE